MTEIKKKLNLHKGRNFKFLGLASDNKSFRILDQSDNVEDVVSEDFLRQAVTVLGAKISGVSDDVFVKARGKSHTFVKKLENASTLSSMDTVFDDVFPEFYQSLTPSDLLVLMEKYGMKTDALVKVVNPAFADGAYNDKIEVGKEYKRMPTDKVSWEQAIGVIPVTGVKEQKLAENLKAFVKVELNKISKVAVQEVVHQAQEVAGSFEELQRPMTHDDMKKALAENLCYIIQHSTKGGLTSYLGTSNVNILNSIYGEKFWEIHTLAKKLTELSRRTNIISREREHTQNPDYSDVLSGSLRVRPSKTDILEFSSENYSIDNTGNAVSRFYICKDLKQQGNTDLPLIPDNSITDAEPNKYTVDKEIYNAVAATQGNIAQEDFIKFMLKPWGGTIEGLLVAIRSLATDNDGYIQPYCYKTAKNGGKELMRHKDNTPMENPYVMQVQGSFVVNNDSATKYLNELYDNYMKKKSFVDYISKTGLMKF